MAWSKVFHSTVFRLLLGAGFFALVWLILSRSFDLNELLETIGAFPIGVFVVLLACSVLVNFLKGVRFYVLVNHVGITLGFWPTLKLFFASQAATPIPAGETIRAAMLRQQTGASLSRVTAPVLGQAVYEIGAAVVVMFIASLFYTELLIPSVVVTALLLLIVFILLNHTAFEFILKLLSKFKFIRNEAERLRSARHNLKVNFELLEKGGFDGHVIKAVTPACLAQAVGGLLVLIAAHVFAIDINYFQATLVYSSGVILQGLFTVIPGGLGVTEGGMSGVLHILGADFSTALALVIIIRLATLLFPVVVGFIFFSLFYAKRTFFPHLS